MPASFRFVLGPLLLGAGCIVAAMVAPVSAQSVYAWKDARGVTHYSDSPPPASEKKAVRTVDVPPAPPAPAAAKRAPVATPATVARAPGPPVPDPAAEKAAAEQRAAACKQAQDNLKVLQANAAVGMDKDGDGKNDAVLTAEERTKHTNDMQATVQANCAPAAP